MDHLTDGRLQAYLDAELIRDEAADVAEHLMTCTDCRVRLGELRLAGEGLRRALTDLDSGLGLDEKVAATIAGGDRLRSPVERTVATGRSALWRAAVMLLAVAGIAAAVVPGSPLREVLEGFLAGEPEVARPVSVEAPAVAPAPAATPGIGSITVTPVDGRVAVHVQQFAEGSTVRVRLVSGSAVRARLLSGLSGARFSVGPGTLFVVGNRSGIAGDILVELPRGLESATVEVDGKRALVASPEGLRASGDRGDPAQDEVVLRVGG